MAGKNKSDLSKKIQPIGGKILVKPVEQEKTTQSGIIIPDTASEEKPQEGIIIALGSGKRDENGKIIPFSVKVGDRILFKKYSPEEFEYESQKFLILDEDDILAIIK